MKTGDNIFVYGTLRPGRGANYFMQGRSEHVGTTRIKARMYDLGSYPGVRLDDCTDWVTGDLYRITDDSLPTLLDRYEGYPDYYGRKMVTTEDGHDTWVYEIGFVPANGSYMPSGEWNGVNS
jgi:gamma-glutamylcyclotransferase (GGCT)/AIG2-like uncharacterized protein YtfP